MNLFKELLSGLWVPVRTVVLKHLQTVTTPLCALLEALSLNPIDFQKADKNP